MTEEYGHISDAFDNLPEEELLMTEDIQMPNGDFLKNYPDVTRVEVIGKNREYIRYGCSNVQVSLQDDGRTLKVFANYD